MCRHLLLDPSQLDVATAGGEKKRFVVAAAGQGKTEVLVERLLSLEEQGLSTIDEILVLSFSRAAVEAVRSRSAKAGIRSTSIMTFDAFASRLILDEGIEPEFGFDARIRQATEILRGTEIPQLVEPLQHVLVDEAQDLVGDRAEMVRALLSALDAGAGFTILGDPLQGIYDFQLEGSVSDLTSAGLIRKIISEFGAEVSTLTGHYRATTDEMKGLIPVAERIRSFTESPADAAAAHELVEAFLPDKIGPNFLAERGALEPLDQETTALLTSTNFEVLIASELLWEQGIEHVVRRRANEMSLAPWVYKALGDLPARTYPIDQILERLRTLDGIDPDEAWRQLKLSEGNLNQYGSLDLARLPRRLGSRSVPFSLTVNDAHRLTLSTVHRSKGLEFSNVIYIPPRKESRADGLDWPALRQKYVALSRAREQVIHSDFPRNTVTPSRKSADGENWIECRFIGRGKLVPARMEFGNADIDDIVPFAHVDYPADRIMTELLRPDLIGLEVDGVLDPESVREGMPARYVLVTREGTPLGRTSPRFAWTLKNTFQRHGSIPWNWPSGFSSARVISLETATGIAGEAAVAGLAPSGMWLVPRLTGLIRPSWK